MKQKRSTKKALLMSALSLLMCVSMLIGTTFAWFTDSVSSVNNIIKAGNLDVVLEYWNGEDYEEVTSTTNVFEENTLWEPGHTEVVYLKVSNLGSLALKYNLGVNIVNEIESINKDGKALRLSDYIEFAAIDGVDTPYDNRAEARAAVTDSEILSTGYTKAGVIEAGDAAQYVALVVYMPESVGNEANHRAGEVVPKIDLGINLMATQQTKEADSFDNLYDEDSKFGGLPTARVTVLADLPEVTTINNNTYTLDTAYVFNTTETYNEAQVNAHRYWHADFVASFDRDVDDAAIGLAGQYDFYSPDWLAFELDGFGDIAANTPVRMLEFAGISMNYGELCNFVKEFSCGAFAVDPEAMAGVTMTVELRLYETEEPSVSNGNSTNVETGEYATIGTYSHTFASIKAADATELTAALNAGVGAIELAAGTYTMPAAVKNKTVTISGTKDTVIDVSKGLTYINGADVTFDGVTIKSTAGTGYNYGFADAKATTFNNCVIEGTLGLDYSCEFKNCTFNVSGNNYNLWTWGAGTASFTGCTFNCDGKAILVYANVLDNGTAHQTVNITGCTFNDNGDDTVTGKAAIEITNTYADPVRTYDVIIKDTTVNGFAQTVPGAGDFNAAYGSVVGSNIGTNVWGNKCSLPNTQINVVIDGVDVY